MLSVQKFNIHAKSFHPISLKKHVRMYVHIEIYRTYSKCANRVSLPADEKRISFPANGRDCNGLLGRLGAVLCSLLVGDDCHAAGQDNLYIMPTRSLYVCL